MKLVECKNALKSAVVSSSDRSKAVVLVVFILCIALW